MPTRSGQTGVVDHDRALRHRALGWLQVGLIAILVVYVALVATVLREFSPRTVIFPAVLALGVAVQRVLWRRGRDTLCGHVSMASLVVGTGIGLGINGVSAPVVLTPLICTFFAGYLLGTRMAWVYGLLSLSFVWIAQLAQSRGWIHSEPAPAGVWFRVLVILDLVAVQSLVFLSLGLRSAVRFHRREEESLEKTLVELERRRTELELEVRSRTADLERTNEDLSDFSRAVSHDLKGPVRAVHGYLDILRDSRRDPGSAPVVERLFERTRQIESLLESALSRGGAPRRT